MNVKMTSWHYRAVDYFNIEHSGSLCFYFWQVVASVVFLPLCVVLGTSTLAVFVITAGIGVFTFPVALFEFMAFEENSYLAISCIFGFFVYAASLFIGAEKGTKAFFRYLRNTEKVEPATENLFVAYVKAKKRKVCPIITYID